MINEGEPQRETTFPENDRQRVRNLLGTKEFVAYYALSELRDEIINRRSAGQEVDWIMEKFEMIDAQARSALSQVLSSQGWNSFEISTAIMVRLGHIRLPDPQ